MCDTEKMFKIQILYLSELKKKHQKPKPQNTFSSPIENLDLILIGSLRQVKIPRARDLFALSEYIRLENQDVHPNTSHAGTPHVTVG